MKENCRKAKFPLRNPRSDSSSVKLPVLLIRPGGGWDDRRRDAGVLPVAHRTPIRLPGANIGPRSGVGRLPSTVGRMRNLLARKVRKYVDICIGTSRYGSPANPKIWVKIGTPKFGVTLKFGSILQLFNFAPGRVLYWCNPRRRVILANQVQKHCIFSATFKISAKIFLSFWNYHTHNWQSDLDSAVGAMKSPIRTIALSAACKWRIESC